VVWLFRKMVYTSNGCWKWVALLLHDFNDYDICFASTLVLDNVTLFGWGIFEFPVAFTIICMASGPSSLYCPICTSCFHPLLAWFSWIRVVLNWLQAFVHSSSSLSKHCLVFDGVFSRDVCAFVDSGAWYDYRRGICWLLWTPQGHASWSRIGGLKSQWLY